MRFFLSICLIFFSFTLRAQQTTFKVKKENDSIDLPNVTLHFPDSENDSSIFAAYVNILIVKSKNYNLHIVTSTNAILQKKSDSLYYFVTRCFENKVDFTIYLLDKNDTIFLKSESRNIYVLPVHTTFFGNYSSWNSLVNKNDLKSINKLKVKVPGITLELEGYKVESFRMIVSTSNKIYISSSEFLTKEMLEILKTLKSGDKIVFSNIKVSLDGRLRDMPILELVVN